jgi:hypothetical protein
MEGGHNFVPKDVCDTTVTLSDDEPSNHHVPDVIVSKKMTIYVDNAYPQFDSHLYFFLKNSGTVPAHVRCVFVSASAETGGGTPYPMTMKEDGWTYDGECWVNTGSFFDPQADEGRGADVILWTIKLCVDFDPEYPCDVQLEPCVNNPAEIHFEFTQEAQECHTYKFSFAIDAIQWNMDWEWDL